MCHWPSREAPDRNMWIDFTRHTICPAGVTPPWQNVEYVSQDKAEKWCWMSDHRGAVQAERPGQDGRAADMFWPHAGRSALSLGCLPMTTEQKYAATEADFATTAMHWLSVCVSVCVGGQVVTFLCDAFCAQQFYKWTFNLWNLTPKPPGHASFRLVSCDVCCSS